MIRLWKNGENSNPIYWAENVLVNVRHNFISKAGK